MHFSLDLINFSGADSLHMLFFAVLFAVLIRIKAVLITLSVVAGKTRRLLSTFILFDIYVICDANFDCKDTQIYKILTICVIFIKQHVKKMHKLLY